MATVGSNTLPGSTQLRTANGLVRLDELSGSGPQGAQSPPGEKGNQGDPGAVDTSNFYSTLQTDFAIMAARPSASLSDGVKVYASNTNEIRNILGIGVLSHIYS